MNIHHVNGLKNFGIYIFFDFLVSQSSEFNILKTFMDYLILLYRRILLRDISIHCPVCLQLHYWKNGTEARKYQPRVQKYICPYCRKQFCDNTFTPFYYCKYPVFLILGVIWLKGKEGYNIFQLRNYCIFSYLGKLFTPCYHTIARWIRKFGSLVIEGSHKFELKACRWKPWQFDEMYSSRILPAPEGKYVKNGKKQIGRVGIKDPTTQLCFMESTKNQNNVILNNIFQRAKTRFNQTPRTAVSDGHLGYVPVFENTQTKHKVVFHNREWVNKEGYHTNNIENHWSQTRAWERPARGYKKFETHSFYTKFNETMYNFFRPNQKIHSLTPAQKAGVKEKLGLLSMILK